MQSDPTIEEDLQNLESVIANFMTANSCSINDYDYIDLDFDDTIVRSQYRKLSIISSILIKKYSINLKFSDLEKLDRSEIINVVSSIKSEVIAKTLNSEISASLLNFYGALKISTENKRFISEFKDKCEIVSAGNINEISTCLEYNGLSGLRMVFTSLDKSKVLQDRKKKYKKCLFVGNSEDDYLSAKKSGMEFIKVT